MNIKAIAKERQVISEVLMQVANKLDDMLDVNRADALTLMASELLEEYVPRLPNRQAQSVNDQHSNRDEYTTNLNYSEREDEEDEDAEYDRFIHADDDEDLDFDFDGRGKSVDVRELDSIDAFARSLMEKGGRTSEAAIVRDGISFGSDPYAEFMKAREGKDGGKRTIDKGAGYREMQERLADRADRAARKNGTMVEERVQTPEDIIFSRIIEARKVYDTLMRKSELSPSDDKKYMQVTQFLKQYDPQYTGM